MMKYSQSTNFIEYKFYGVPNPCDVNDTPDDILPLRAPNHHYRYISYEWGYKIPMTLGSLYSIRQYWTPGPFFVGSAFCVTGHIPSIHYSAVYKYVFRSVV